METISIALTGDTHADGDSRFADHNRILQWIADDACARKCVALFHSGDAYERARTTPEEREAVATWAERVSRYMPLVMVAGNHDNPLDIEMIGRLHGVHPIHAVTVPQTLVVGELHGITVHCLPWPRRAHLVAARAGVHAEFVAEESRDSLNVAGADALRNVLRGFSLGRATDDAPSILLAHAMVRGSKTSVSQPPMVGHDFELGLEDLALAEADAVALGHIHMRQEWEINAHLYELPPHEGMHGAPVVYPGSPRRCNFGETEEKSYTVLTFDGRRCVDVERVLTPAPPMIHVAAVFNPNDGKLYPVARLPEHVNGAEIRLRYDVPAAHRAAARHAAEALGAELGALCNATAIKVEERVEVETRARAPEVTAAVTTWDKLNAHWAARKSGPGERLEQVKEKFIQLEGPL